MEETPGLPERGSGDPSYERLRYLQSISEAALAHLHFDELIGELLRRLTGILSADTAAVLLLDEETNELVARAARGLEEEIDSGARIPLGRGFAGKIAAERRPVAVHDMEHADVLNPVLREKGISSLLGVPLVVEGRVIGVLHVGSLARREFTAEETDLLQLAGDRIAVAIDHARLYEAERVARAAAESAAEQLRRLELLTEAALAHMDLDELLNELLSRLRDVLSADTAAVLLLDEDANELVARAARGLEEEVEQGVRVPVGRGFAGKIAAERRAVAIDLENFEVVNPLLREKGIASLLGVPLLVEGRVVGVLHVGSLTPRTFTVRESELLQLAADRIALAIDHARLYEAEREARAEAERAAERIRRIELITQVALHHLALDSGILQSLLTRVRDVLEVDMAAVLVLDDEEQTLVARASEGFEEEVERGVRVPLGRGFAGTIAERREPWAVEDISQVEVISPLVHARGIRSMLGVPLIVDERVLGVLHVGTIAPRSFTEDDLTLLELAGERLATAIDQSRMYEREHLVAETLQRSLLPEALPDVIGAKLAARYLPGSAESDVGGDWYDVIPLPGGRIGLAMGDVVSRGVRAAAVMGQLRNALRAYALDGRPPAAVLERLEDLLRKLERREMATLLYLVLEPHSLSYTMASAGHPPPLAILPSGEVELLEEGRSPPLGVLADAMYPEASGQLTPGTTLLLYTDGLVERRDMWIDEGLEQLVAEARAAAREEPEALLDRLVARLVPERGPGDDVALLALRATPIERERLLLRLPAEPTVLASMRRTLGQWLAGAGANEDEAYDVLVSTTEAAANAVEHAYGPVDASFDVEARMLAEGEIEILVRDHGRWRPPRGHNRGRGTLLMQELMDHFEVVTGEDGTEVTMRRRLAHAEALV